MKLLCDESVRLPILLRLAEDGHEIHSIRDIAPAAPDEEVLTIASDMGLPLITMDVGFGALVYRDRVAVPGLLLLRLHGLTWNEKAEIASLAMSTAGDKLERSFVVAGRRTLRIRRLPRSDP